MIDSTPAEITSPAIRMPAKIRLKAFQRSTPKRNARMLPVALPLPGIGRATKAMMKIAPYL